MTGPRDRRATLLGRTDLNGIDFVEVTSAAQTRLRVHFVNQQPDAAALGASLTSATIEGGDAIPIVQVTQLAWATTPAGYPALDLSVAAPGDFSNYTLRLETAGPTLDRYFDHASFSFKANCPSTLDCERPGADCPPAADLAPPIDRLAKDFDSFRRALTAFSALRYPAWQERSEADFGMMFMEALASVADDLSYQQDRIAAEAWLDTATERRSLVRLARLVDYEPRVATAARVLLHFEMTGDAGRSIPAGLVISALAPDGAPVDFETGSGLDDSADYLTHPSWNALQPHWFDDSQRCLSRGSTEMWIESPAQPLHDEQWILLDTAAAKSADTPVRELVQLIHVDAPEVDRLFGVRVTRIAWRAEQALRFEHDLTRTKARANLVPATHGRRYSDTFVVPSDAPAASEPPRAIVRTGANGTPQFLHTLRHAPLASLAPDDPLEGARPEIRLIQTRTAEPRTWSWRRSLIGATAFDESFTTDPAGYRPVPGATGAAEYDGDEGVTLRFGDGVFGLIPAEGATFDVTYRAGGGTRGNVAADALTRVDLNDQRATNVVSVTNPFPAAGGRDEEPASQVREMAPQRFRATQYRAVRAEDYDRAAMTRPWVQRAGTQFRYTGSWLSVFTAVDPRTSVSLPDERALELTTLFDRYRLAGYEAFPVTPRYASLDLDVTVCARPDAFMSDVARGVLAALDSAVHTDGSVGFFHPDRFTFGGALERSALEAVLQDVAGVDGVIALRYRRRGHTPGFIAIPDSVEVAADEILRVDNDPDHPESGSVRIDVRGGK